MLSIKIELKETEQGFLVDVHRKEKDSSVLELEATIYLCDCMRLALETFVKCNKREFISSPIKRN